MCLILFAVNPHPELRLVVAANRDEQHGRATLRADFWQDAPQILGGRDLVAGGTWLGVTKTGRFAAVTNFAEPPPDPLPPRSRGDLTANFLSSDIGCCEYLETVADRADAYRGFNLLLSDGNEVYYYSNRAKQIKQLAPGFYGLSNQLLDCDWPKVIDGKEQLAQFVQAGSDLTNNLFQMLGERGNDTPHSAKFILGETYGTGVSTVVLGTGETIRFTEKAFAPDGSETGEKTFTINLTKAVT